MNDEVSAGFQMFSQPADNNRQFILAQLQRFLSGPEPAVLEIGSGSGQHAAYFASQWPEVTWQPSDRGDYFEALRNNLAQLQLLNVLSPIYLDVAEFPDQIDINSAYCANVLHIMPERLIPPG